MKNILLILIAVISITSTSCVTRKACDRKYPPAVRDSIRIKDSVAIHDSTIIKVKIKDSTVVTQEVKGKDSLPCNENAKATIVRGGDKVVVEVRNGKVYVDYNLAGTISRFNSVIEEKDRTIKELKFKDNFREKVVVKEKITNEIPLIITILAWIGGISLVLIIGKLALKRVSLFLL